MRRPVTVARDETSNERQNGQLPSVTKLEEGADHQDCEDKEDGEDKDDNGDKDDVEYIDASLFNLREDEADYEYKDD